MHIIRTSLHRPISTWMFFAALVLFGLIGFFKLPQELLPSLEYPEINCVTEYPNAGPSEVEKLVTIPLEEVCSGVSHLERMSSVSREGGALLRLQFSWSTSLDRAFFDVRQRLDTVIEKLPEEVSFPVLLRYNPFEQPLMRFAISSPRSLWVMTKIMEQMFVNRLEKVKGVGVVRILGGAKRNIFVDVSVEKLAAHQCTLDQVYTALKDTSIAYPGGKAYQDRYEYAIRTISEYNSLEDIGAVAFAKGKRQKPRRGATGKEEIPAKSMVFVKDIANIYRGPAQSKSFSRLNTKDCVTLDIIKASGANSIQTADLVMQTIAKLMRFLGNDAAMQVVFNEAQFIKQSMKGLMIAALQAAVLASLVLFFFLGRIHIALGVILAIPVSLISTFVFLYLGGISLNIMSLAGIALGIGMLVDNAIVVVENSMRIFREGKVAWDAAYEGAREVVWPLISSTFTTIAVFFPLIYLGGIEGQLFGDLSFSVVCSLLVSLVVSFTIIPVVFLRIFRGASVEGMAFPRFGLRIKSVYVATLKHVLGHAWIVSVVAIVLAVIGVVTFSAMDVSLIPSVQQKKFLIKVTPRVENTTVKQLDKVVGEIEEVLSEQDDVEAVAVSGGLASGLEGEYAFLQELSASISVTVKKASLVSKTKNEIAQQLGRFRQSGYQVEFAEVGSFVSGLYRGGAREIVVAVEGDQMEICQDHALKVRDMLSQIEGLEEARTSTQMKAREIRVKPDPYKAAYHRINPKKMAESLEIAFGGKRAADAQLDGTKMDVMLRLFPDKTISPEEVLKRVPLQGRDESIVRLDDVASISLGQQEDDKVRIERRPTVLVRARVLRGGIRRKERAVEALIQEQFPEQGSYRVYLAGQKHERDRAFRNLLLTLILSGVLVFMIMAAQFESIKKPFVILCSLPLALVGSLCASYCTGTPLSVMVLLGMIILCGISVNSGIILVDRINLLRRRGVGLHEAVVVGAGQRIRPILMTVLTTILGLVPVALQLWQGSELWSGLAISIIGGLIVSTFLTLYLVPVLYVASEKK